jgi:hypothetical protein
MKTKIYGFFNSINEFGDAEGIAITLDGRIASTHISSSERFSRSDLCMNGNISDHYAELYNAVAPDGYELEFVRIRDNRDDHEGLKCALAALNARNALDIYMFEQGAFDASSTSTL